MLPEQAIEISKVRMDHAKECLQDAKLLLAGESYRSAANRAYYAIFHVNELRFSNNFVEKRSSSFLKALRNQDFLSRTLLCIGLKSLKLQNEYFYDSA